MRPSFFHACISGTMVSTLTRLWHSIRSILSRHRRSRESRRLSSACLPSARYSPERGPNKRAGRSEQMDDLVNVVHGRVLCVSRLDDQRRGRGIVACQDEVAFTCLLGARARATGRRGDARTILSLPVWSGDGSDRRHTQSPPSGSRASTSRRRRRGRILESERGGRAIHYYEQRRTTFPHRYPTRGGRIARRQDTRSVVHRNSRPESSPSRCAVLAA
jgi:hypothetical protein